MNDKYLLPLYIIGTLLLTGFAVTFVIFIIIQKQRQVKERIERQQLAFNYSTSLLDTKIEVQEATLKMISGELHDNINQVLASGLMQISSIEKVVSEQKIHGVILETKRTIKKAISDIRLLSHNLNTSMVENREIEEAIQSELERISAFSGIICSLDSEAMHEPNPEQRLLLFRIIQEGLQNVIKHAKAKTIDVNINSAENWFSVSLIDDGIGFDPQDDSGKKSSLGMQNMRERIKLLNGSLKIRSKIGYGTQLDIEIPLTQ